MGFFDFFETITDGFTIRCKWEELKQIGRETREEFGELFEEGQELFTVGTKRMLIDGDENYQTTTEKRAGYRRAIREARERILEARGVTDESRPLFRFARFEMKGLLRRLGEVPEKELGCALRDKFEYLAICHLDELSALRDYLLELENLPAPPEYKKPEKLGNPMGPVILFTGDIFRREEATRRYCQAVDAYTELLEKAADGTLDGLQLELLGERGKRTLTEVCHRLSGYGPGLGDFNVTSLDDCLILLSAFHLLVCSAILRKGAEPEALTPEVLAEIESWLEATQPEVDPQEED